MAKSKKSASGGAAAKKKQTTPPAAAPASPQSVIDTSLAASAVARSVANKALLQPETTADSGSEASRKQTSTFKHLKEGIAKPHVQSLNTLLDSTAGGQKKSGLPFVPPKQVGHNQTFGAGCEPP